MTPPAMKPADAEALVRRLTREARAPLVPEIPLLLAEEIAPTWEAIEEELGQKGVEPPFWAFAWAGSVALARLVLDEPELVRGRVVLDFACGGGLSAIAAARAGAARVLANDVDPLALVAARLNAALNGVALETSVDDLTREPEALGTQPELILAGDICYEQPTSTRVLTWLHARREAGALVLLADPGRAYLPGRGLVPRARYPVPTPKEIESVVVRDTVVYELAGE